MRDFCGTWAILKPAEIAALRIAAQKIGSTEKSSVATVVAHLCALQAQDFPMSKWAIGIRSVGLTQADVDQAIERGDIIRTHALRPTWHLLANADVDWILKLTAPQIMVTMRSRHKQLGLDEKLITQCKKVIEKDFRVADSRTRAELIAALKTAKINLAAECYSHILLRCELDRLICSGPVQGSDTAYALYARRIRKTENLPRDEALARLAGRYFTSHGPATLEDFIWWSGLKIGDARIADAAVEKQFRSEKVAEATYLMPKTAGPAREGVYLLPAFDEFIIGYSDRSAVLARGMSPKVISNNGIFRATIVANGVVTGIWKREVKRGKFLFLPQFFGKADARLKATVAKKAGELAVFWGHFR